MAMVGGGHIIHVALLDELRVKVTATDLPSCVQRVMVLTATVRDSLPSD